LLVKMDGTVSNVTFECPQGVWEGDNLRRYPCWYCVIVFIFVSKNC
jgi:hypothetical protein